MRTFRYRDIEQFLGSRDREGFVPLAHDVLDNTDLYLVARKLSETSLTFNSSFIDMRRGENHAISSVCLIHLIIIKSNWYDIPLLLPLEESYTYYCLVQQKRPSITAIKSDCIPFASFNWDPSMNAFRIKYNQCTSLTCEDFR